MGDQTQELPSQIGRYEVRKLIGKGGMGEVFLVFDPVCQREVALKRIRPDLKDKEVLLRRFLRESQITGQLAHPGVIPIYSIHQDEQSIYYTMPYVQGRTLKSILKQASREEKDPEKHGQAMGSIRSLTRVFMSICQAVAYAHKQGVLHRDIKPENVMLGRYGEVHILDWGLAKRIADPEETLPELKEEVEVTQPGKVFGTVSYMAPERALGEVASIGSDVYALGVTLYEILCLHLPFDRSSLADLRKTWRKEKLVNPAELAPYRNVPRMLARIARNCLRVMPDERYQSVDEIVCDLENYIEGRSEWFQIGRLDVARKEDWEFQEHVYLADHIALAGDTAASEWVSMMISKESYPGNTRMMARIRIEEDGNGVGLLMSVPERAEREHLDDGYTLWIGSDRSKGVKLYRAGIEVADEPELFLRRGQWYELRLEKVDNSLRFYINGDLKLSFVSHLPLPGTHVGLLHRDPDYAIEDLCVFVGSYRVNVNCLAVPDAFLAAKEYDKALAEYRRVAYSFPERDEGREAQFRAGVTLLERAKTSEDPAYFDHALEEFGKLHATPGAPLEYLGKALVYRTQRNAEEESKCFEMAFRKYRKHPLLPVLQEQAVYRMHEASRRDRLSAYRFVLLAAQHLPKVWEEKDTQKLAQQMVGHWESLYFVDPKANQDRLGVALQLAFWLGRVQTLGELVAAVDDPTDALFSLIELGSWGFAEKLLSGHSGLDLLIEVNRQSLSALLGKLPPQLAPRIAFYLMEFALRHQQPNLVHTLRYRLRNLTQEERMRADSYSIWAHMLEEEWTDAAFILDRYPLELLNQETTLLHPIYGCYLAATEGEELALIHFAGTLDSAYPRSWALISQYLTGRLDQIHLETQSFLYEKRILYRHLALYYHCLGNQSQEAHFRTLESKQYIHLAD